MVEKRIQIVVGQLTIAGTLNRSPTAERFWQALPIEGDAQTWGDEIYFGTPVAAAEDPDWAAETVTLGAIGYWPPGNALCLFFGPTPLSRGNEIRPASPVNVLGMIDGDPTVLKRVDPGTRVTIQPAPEI
jgi:uncharacterized protein